MNPRTLQIAYPIVLALHGIGHVMGIVPAVGLFSTERWHAGSWLLTPLFGDSLTRLVGIAVWIMTTIGFLIAGAGALGWAPAQDFWRGLAIVMAIVSLVAVVIFWNSFAATHNKLGAIAVNLIVIVGLLVLDWPSTAVIK